MACNKTTELSSIGRRLIEEGENSDAKDNAAGVAMNKPSRTGRKLRRGLAAATVLAAFTSAAAAHEAECKRLHAPNDASGRTRLHYAAQQGNAGCATWLIVVAGADPNAKADDGRTPLQLAKKRGNEAVAGLLISAR